MAFSGDEHDGSSAPATRIAAIAFADCDYSFIIGVDGRPGMLFQFRHLIPSVVRRPWEEKNSHLRYRAEGAETTMQCYNITYFKSMSLFDRLGHRWQAPHLILKAGLMARPATERSQGAAPMATCTEKHHANHTHQHGPNCGHTAIRHDGHVDYLHDGHLHHMHEDHVDEHAIAVNSTNPAKCTPEVHCSHAHGPNCGHQQVPHGDHIDYLVDGRLHHPHGGHCDDHGPVQLA